MISSIIHQYWDGVLPKQYKEFSEDFQKLNPNFKYFLWNKESVLSECSQHILYEHLKESNHPVVSSDIARIIILDLFGGIYFDSDMRPEQSIPLWILENKAFACYEHEKVLGQTIANGAVASEPSGVFVEKLIQEISKINPLDIKKIDKKKCWLILGPRLWTKVFFDLYPDGCITVYPSWYFIPTHYCDDSLNNKKKGLITTHIWQDSYTKNHKWNNIIHYSHNQKTVLIDSFEEITNLQHR